MQPLPIMISLPKQFSLSLIPSLICLALSAINLKGKPDVFIRFMENCSAPIYGIKNRAWNDCCTKSKSLRHRRAIYKLINLTHILAFDIPTNTTNLNHFS